MSKVWKKGRGKLGFLQPLLGNWAATAETPIGAVRCTRAFTLVLGGSYVRLDARWEFGAAGAKAPALCADAPSKGAYEELALIGVGADRKVGFWSFTSDGKHSQGTVADVTDLHPSAIGFEAHMPAGLARMAYWPDDGDGYFWVVESKNAKGWKRFVQHHYQRA